MIAYDENHKAIEIVGRADLWRWKPKLDISTWELSLCLPPLLSGRAELVNDLPDYAKRHFEREDAYKG